MRLSLFALILVMVIGCQSSPRRELPTVPESELGNQAFAGGDYQGAVQHYDVWLGKYPQDAEVFFQRGRANYKLGQYEAALKDFEDALKFYPENVRPMAYSCCVLMALDRENEARRAVNAVSNHPKYSSLGEYEQFLFFVCDGILKNRIKDYEGALLSLDKAVEIANLYPNVFANYGSPFMKRHALYNRAITRFAVGWFDDPLVEDMEEYVKLAEQAGDATADDYKTLAIACFLTHRSARCKQVVANLKPEERQELGKAVDDVPLFTQP